MKSKTAQISEWNKEVKKKVKVEFNIKREEIFKENQILKTKKFNKANKMLSGKSY